MVIVRRKSCKTGRGRPAVKTEEYEKAPAREERLRELYLRQKHTLDVFLEHGAISREQYDKSLGDLTKKMGMEKER